jgi:hypothetical protein
MLTECRRFGRFYNMANLPPHQLALFQRAAAGGMEIDGTTFLNVSDFSGPEIGQLEKGLWLAGVLRKGERL